MECKEVKNNLTAYLDQEAGPSLTAEIKSHLESCPRCFLENQQMSRAWHMLDLAPQIEPSPDYVSRFWTKVATQESVYERFAKRFRNLLNNRHLVPVATALSLALIIGSTTMIRQINVQNNLSQLKADDIEMLQNMDLAAHFETIKDLDVIRDLGSSQNEGAM